ncbi:MAG TPA: hypothetical protein VGD33_09875 [Chitinophagaceae bacterium]|jgi:hypothetical protein
MPFVVKNNRRYRTGPVQFKDGFYIEVCNKGVKTGVKIRSESQQIMEAAASKYSSYKEVIILGEYRDGIPLKESLPLNQ